MIAASIAFSFLLIPKYGFVGASYALVVAEGIGFIFGLFVANSFELVFPFKVIMKYLVASLTMAAGIWLLPYLPLQILVGVIIYIAVNFMIGGLEKEEIYKLLPTRVS